METTQAIFNTVLAVFIVTTVLVVAFAVRPLIGWCIAELFALATPAFVAMALLWSAPGAPIGAKLVMTANADVQTGAALGDGVSLPVGDLIATVAALQLIPFALGILTRRWAEPRAIEWSDFAQRTSNVTFLFVRRPAHAFELEAEPERGTP